MSKLTAQEIRWMHKVSQDTEFCREGVDAIEEIAYAIGAIADAEEGAEPLTEDQMHLASLALFVFAEHLRQTAPTQ